MVGDMPVDPSAMHAFVSNPVEEAEAADAETDGAEPEAGDDEEGAEGDGGTPEWHPLIPLLIENIADIESVADDIDQDALIDTQMEFEEDDVETMVQGIGTLDRKLQNKLRELAQAGVLESAAEEIAEMLSNNGSIDDPERFSGWLTRAGEVLATEGGDDEDEEGDLPDPESLVDEVDAEDTP